MCDTQKIQRPLFTRRQQDSGGRLKETADGRVVLVKTRYSDEQKPPGLDEALYPGDAIEQMSGLTIPLD